MKLKRLRVAAGTVTVINVVRYFHLFHLLTGTGIGEGISLISNITETLCNGDVAMFSCRTNGPATLHLWYISGLSNEESINDATSRSIATRQSMRFSTTDGRGPSDHSNITISNFTGADNGAVVNCTDYRSSSQSIVINVGAPSCTVDVIVGDRVGSNISVSWSIGYCSVQPTEFQVIWSEVGSDIETRSQVISASASELYRFVIEDAKNCKDYLVKVQLMNRCGTGSLGEAISDNFSKASMNILVLPDKDCPLMPMKFKIAFSDPYVEKCLNSSKATLHYQIERIEEKDNLSNVLSEGSVLFQLGETYETGRLLLPVVSRPYIFTVSVKGTNLTNSIEISGSKILHLMWTVTSKIISVTCMVPCQDEELYREFELKCRMYPPDGRELNVTETLTGGRAVLNLADIKSVQTLVVELLYNDTVIDNSTVIIIEDEGIKTKLSVVEMFVIGFSGAFLCVFLLIAVIMTKVCYHKITSKQGNQQQQVQEIHISSRDITEAKSDSTSTGQAGEYAELSIIDKSEMMGCNSVPLTLLDKEGNYAQID